ncbi:hypothetical protein O181_050516 [Austropuccinia psidii MF-1]|uniref:Uncharacterized protein n=1 Tax=Austropuccinia psidii MF-1 TaxID=1389203 RepID=A0A9Q3E1Y7_9BASI|nr:hypothetical protein [Austropuccinia psidii MF-1]
MPHLCTMILKPSSRITCFVKDIDAIPQAFFFAILWLVLSIGNQLFQSPMPYLNIETHAHLVGIWQAGLLFRNISNFNCIPLTTVYDTIIKYQKLGTTQMQKKKSGQPTKLTERNHQELSLIITRASTHALDPKNHTYDPRTSNGALRLPKLIVIGQSMTRPKSFGLTNRPLSLENELIGYEFGGRPARSGTWKIWQSTTDLADNW